MRLVKKNIIYFKHILHMTFSNIPRLILSVSGLFVGLLVLAVGSILMDTYYGELKTKADEYSDSTVILSICAQEKDIDDIVEKVGDDSVWRNITADFKETIYNELYSNDYRVVLNTNIIGSSPTINNNVLMNYDENTVMPVNAKLVSGRWISGQDLANNRNVVVIDDFTAKLLFGNISCIGQLVEFGINEKGTVNISEGEDKEVKKTEKYEVIGVIKNNILTSENEFKLKKFKKSGEENIILDTRIYIPLTTYKDKYEEEGNAIEYLIWKQDGKGNDNILSKLEECELFFSSRCDKYNVVTKNSILEKLEKEITPIKSFMILILSALFIISGINSMNIMFFSIKERLEEIGIKKAMGATDFDIILQFLMEGLITSYIAGIIAAFFAGIVAKVLGMVIENKLFISFNVIYTKDTLMLLFIITSFYSILFSFFPSYYGAKSKVTDALRFE